METIANERPKELPHVEINADRYRDLAQSLYDVHDAQIGFDPPEDLLLDVRDFSHEVLSQYWGHGVVRDTGPDNLASLLSILDTEVMIGDAGPLVGGRPNAYTDSYFFIISRRGGRSLIKGLEAGRPERVLVDIRSGVGVETKRGVRVDIGAVICGAAVDVLVEPLRKLFPYVRILRAVELRSYIQEEETRVKNES